MSFEPGVSALFVRNPNYWKGDGKPYLDEVETIGIPDPTSRFNALQAGDIHAMTKLDPSLLARAKGMSNVEVMSTPGPAHATYPMRSDAAPFDSNDVRLAMKYAMDRKKLLELAYAGQGTVAMEILRQHQGPLDAVFVAIGGGGLISMAHATIGDILAPRERAKYQAYFLAVFGKPKRVSVCECERSPDENLAQALHLLNSDEIQGKLSRANALVLGCLFYIVGWASLGWMRTFEWALLFILVITAGEVTLTPTSSAVVARVNGPLVVARPRVPTR